MRAPLALLLAIAWLIAGSSSAQPGRTGPALIDTAEECVALQGNWKPGGDGWRAACEVRWSREECLRLGGAWTQIAKAATGGRCMAGVSEQARARQCLDSGGSWGPPGAPTPMCTFEPARPRVAQAADAGKLCDSQTDCTYGCVYQGPPVAAGADVMGRCRATRIASGCFSMVESGRVAGSICAK
jgi:hypothetical protein